MSVTDEKDPYTQPTRGFGAVEQADETRQAQQVLANDATLDVNMNSVIVRSQALTVATAGRAFTAGQERRSMIADFLLAKLGAQMPAQP